LREKNIRGIFELILQSESVHYYYYYYRYYTYIIIVIISFVHLQVQSSMTQDSIYFMNRTSKALGALTVRENTFHNVCLTIFSGMWDASILYLLQVAKSSQ